MKRQYFFLLFLLTLILSVMGHAQDNVTAVDSLAVDIWPDYDRPSVLVLMTGTLLADTELPASVALPFPKAAQLNAVARIDGSDGVMKDDIVYNQAPDEITFITPDLRFRVEYYLPYTINDKQRTFDFEWLAGLSVDFFQLRIQQPRSASSLTTVPGTIDVSTGGDGFTYHAFPIRAVPAGETFSVKVDYTMTSAQLSVARSAPPGAQGTALPSTSKGKGGLNWPLVAVVLVVIVIAIFFVWKTGARRAEVGRPAADQSKPKASGSRFCTKCGNAVDKEDRFCSKCGSALKGR